MTDQRDERGVMTVCFDRETKGTKYLQQVVGMAGSVRALDRDIPILIVTNLDPDKNKVLKALVKFYGVIIKYVDVADNENRHYKTDMYAHSPFKFTAFIDADVVVQSAEFLSGFHFVDGLERDAALVLHQGEEMLLDVTRPRMHYQLQELTKCKEIPFWCSGTIFFRKSPQAAAFFARWHNLYARGSTGFADMFSFNVALVKSPGLCVWLLGWPWSCQDIYNERAIVLHQGSRAGDPLPQARPYLAECGLVEKTESQDDALAVFARKERRILVAGPYFGELGWEIGNLAPYLEWLRRKIKPTQFIVACQTGHDLLYRGATGIHSFDSPQSAPYRDANWLDRPEPRALWEFNEQVELIAKANSCFGDDVLWVQAGRENHRREFKNRDPVLLRPVDDQALENIAGFRLLDGAKYAIITYRHMERGQDKNTPEEVIRDLPWRLKELGLLPVLVGTTTKDLPPKLSFGLNLVGKTTIADLIALYSKASVVIGASTGIMHLAAATNTPHVVWGGGTRGAECRVRYTDTWNLNKTWCRYLGPDWKPDIPAIMDAVTLAVEKGKG